MTEPQRGRYYGKIAKVGLVWAILRQGGGTLLLVPTSMVLARLISPTEAGVAAAAYFFTQLAARLTQFGFGPALVRAKHVSEEHEAAVFSMSLVLGMLAWSALSFGAPLIGGIVKSPETAAVMPVAAFAFVLGAFETVPTALLSREMRFREGTTSDWLATLAESATSIALAWYGFSYWSLVYGQLTGDTVRATSRAWLARWRPSIMTSRQAMREMASFGAGIYARNLLKYAANNLDNLIVGRVLGITALGFYDKAFQTTARFAARLNLAGPSISFRVFALIHEDQERLRRAYRKVILSVTMLGYPALTVMMTTGPEFIEVLFGARWLPAALPLQILCAACMLRLLNEYASSAAQAKGRIWAEVARQALFVAVLVVAVWTLSRWGIAGAAAGVVVATVFMTFLLQSLVRKLAGLTWGDILAPQVPAMWCSAGMGLLLWPVKAALAATFGVLPAWVVLSACIACACAYYVGFVLLGPFKEVRALVLEVLQDLAPGLARRFAYLTPTGNRVAVADR